MRRSENRILTTHVGSLVRTPEIIETMIARELGNPFDAEAHAEQLTAGVREVVQRQAGAGIDVVDDGEYGKVGWTPYLAERLSGLEPVDMRSMGEVGDLYPDAARFGDFYREYQRQETTQWLPDTPSRAQYHGSLNLVALACTGPIAYQPEALERDIQNFRAALDGVEVEEAFIPVAAPCSVELFPNTYYESQTDYLYALADALSVEYRMIVDAGFILQVDDGVLPLRYFASFREKGLAEYKKWAQVRIEALNHALSGIPEDRVRYHVCYGSQNVPHTTDPELIDIIDLILQVHAQGYALESSSPRHEHEWQIWEDVKLPSGKILIPGVISHCTNVVEHPKLIANRIANYADLIGRENVIAGTDCGFSQFWNLIRVHPQVQWAKLEALSAGARLASERLWR